MRKILISICVLLCSIAAVAQQDYVGRYDAYGGFSYLTSPKLNLSQRGFHTQEGVNINSWLSLGFDYSVFTGHSSLKPTELTTGLQTELQNQLAGAVAQNPALLPYAATLLVPYNATTQTFTAGPQFSYRHLKRITFFIHPSVGAIHEKVVARPGHTTNPLAAPVTSYFELTGRLANDGSKTDTTYFYGFGGGFEINATKHVHLRFTSDFVHTNLFDGFLKDPRNAVRFSVGPTFNFGKNVAK